MVSAFCLQAFPTTPQTKTVTTTAATTTTTTKGFGDISPRKIKSKRSAAFIQ
jgi:hypothetical protein